MSISSYMQCWCLSYYFVMHTNSTAKAYRLSLSVGHHRLSVQHLDKFHSVCVWCASLYRIRRIHTQCTYTKRRKAFIYPTSCTRTYTVYRWHQHIWPDESDRLKSHWRKINFCNRLLSTVAKAAESSFNFVLHHCCCVCRVSRIAEYFYSSLHVHI